MNDPVEVLRHELARRLADQLGVPVEVMLGRPGLSYAEVRALMPPTESLTPDHFDRLANGQATAVPGSDSGPGPRLSPGIT